MKLESKLGQVRGLGSPKSGVDHWWIQRVTAIALVPLLLWFISSFVFLVFAPYEEVYEWLSSPWISTFMILFTLCMFYHGYLGMQVIFEDYIPQENTRRVLELSIKFLSLTMAILAVLSCIRILFG